uniref:Uncharacterized protein n=1 Tax=Anguilla anguilla TaxID=7936 RepID=A0A0E9VDS1_ANGAN
MPSKCFYSCQHHPIFSSKFKIFILLYDTEPPLLPDLTLLSDNVH